MWPFLFSGDGDEEVSESIPISTIFRWFIYDVGGDNPNKFAKVFDLTAVSDEGDEKERQDAKQRLQNIESLMPFIRLYASINAVYMYEAQKQDLLKMPHVTEASLEKEGAALKLMYRNMTFAGLASAIATAVELNILEISGGITSIE